MNTGKKEWVYFLLSGCILFTNSFEKNYGQDVEKNVVVDDSAKYLEQNIRKDSTQGNVSSSDTLKILGDKPEVNTTGDTTRIKLGKKGITIVEKNGKTIVDIQDLEKEQEEKEIEIKKYKKEKNKGDYRPHWGGLELTLNNFMSSSFSLSLPQEAEFLELNTGKSLGVRLNIVEYEIPLSPYQGFCTGLGFEFNSYYFSSDSNNITKLNGQIVPKYKPTGSSTYSKNKLKDTYLNIPLLYEIQFPLGNSKKPLYFSAGIIGGLKLGSRTKEYYKINGVKKEEVVKDDFYLRPFRFGYQARIGFRNIHLVATYYQTSLFLKDKGPEIHPFDIGLMLLNW